MSTLKNIAVRTPQEPYRFTKRLGSTTYHVNVHSSETNIETAKDKIARLIKSDAVVRKTVMFSESQYSPQHPQYSDNKFSDPALKKRRKYDNMALLRMMRLPERSII